MRNSSPPNALIHETSPYLLQHAHNPVHWQPWGPSAFQQATKENKLVLISIGYAACHWCHVMEQQCFENEAIAALMNTHYVCIKVDREERPDVDNIYMNAVHLMQGQGGWPLNCFALPNGKPIYGGSYFPPQQWQQILEQIHTHYAVDPQRFHHYAKQLTAEVQQSLGITPSAHSLPFDAKSMHAMYKHINAACDTTEGGFGLAPKFPLPAALEFVLWYGHELSQSQATHFALLSLDKMAKGGIYDQVGGGFARYAVDAIWKVPHFEKMLYDNAQLISLYSTAYQLSRKPRYKQVVEQSLRFIAHEMTNEEGGFYASYDADSEGEEGKYYVWRYEEIIALLGKNAGTAFCQQFSVTPQGNWEAGKNILMQAADNETYSPELLQQLNLLEQARNKRRKPGLDDKVLCAWNAMMISAYADAYAALGHTEYVQAAQTNAHFIWHKMSDGQGRLYRSYKHGKARIAAFAEDYAHLIQAYLRLYQIDFDPLHLERAQLLMQYAQQHFWNATYGLFRYNAKTEAKLIASQIEVNDNVIPASNSVMAHNLYSLGLLLNQQEYVTQAQEMLHCMADQMHSAGIYMAHWHLLWLRQIRPHQEVVIMGDNYKQVAQQIQQHAFFNTIYAASPQKAYLPLMHNREAETADATKIYVCQGASCQLPTTQAAEAVAILSK